MNDDHFVTFLMKIFHWLSLVSFPDYFSAREGGGILAYSVFVPCSLKIGDVPYSKTYYVRSHKAWNYERAVKRRLISEIILLWSFQMLRNKVSQNWTFCQPRKALRQSYWHLKLRNFTLPVVKFKNTHYPFTEDLGLLCQSVLWCYQLSLLHSASTPSLLWLPFIVVYNVIHMKQSDWSTTVA